LGLDDVFFLVAVHTKVPQFVSLATPPATITTTHAQQIADNTQVDAEQAAPFAGNITPAAACATQEGTQE
jgi:hypothetical protein